MIRLVDGDSYETRQSRIQDLTFHEARRAFDYRGIPFDETRFQALGLYSREGVDGDSYETRQSRIQDLTFHEARRAFDYRGIPFDETRFQALGLYSREGVFSNLALLISDQNPHELKLAIFNDDAETEFLNRLECTGSILKQFDDALQFLTFNNNLRSYFPTAQRIDKYDSPPTSRYSSPTKIPMNSSSPSSTTMQRLSSSTAWNAPVRSSSSSTTPSSSSHSTITCAPTSQRRSASTSTTPLSKPCEKDCSTACFTATTMKTHPPW